MTATRPQPYDQCDDTCTADCGHCKGKGRPDPLTDLRDRLDRADRTLTNLERCTPGGAFERKVRLAGKIEGVRLALSYVDEALRTAQPAEEATQ